MFTIAMAYCGSGENRAIKRLLHIAVSDVDNDVRRAAVTSIGFVMFRSDDTIIIICCCLMLTSQCTSSVVPRVNRQRQVFFVGICFVICHLMHKHGNSSSRDGF